MTQTETASETPEIIGGEETVDTTSETPEIEVEEAVARVSEMQISFENVMWALNNAPEAFFRRVRVESFETLHLIQGFASAITDHRNELTFPVRSICQELYSLTRTLIEIEATRLQAFNRHLLVEEMRKPKNVRN